MRDVLHIPKLDRRLLSIAKIVQHGHDDRFVETYYGIYEDDELMISVKRNGKVHMLTLDERFVSRA